MSTAGIWHWAGYVIAAIAVALAVWSLWFRDGRRRTSARCPKCWYDLQGVASAQPGPGLTCPECGHRATAEKQLHRRRRHWRQAGLAAALLAVAYGVWTTPRIQRSGWVGAVPTTVLIAALPWTVPPDDDPLWSYSLDRFMARNTARFPLYFELYQRAKENRSLSWQRRLIAEMCLARVPHPLPREGQFLESGYSDLISAAFRDGQSISASVEKRLDNLVRIDVRTRDRWPTGAPIYIHIEERRFWGGPDSRLTLVPDDPRLASCTKKKMVMRSPIQSMSIWKDELVRGPVIPAGTDGLNLEARLVTGDWEKDQWRLQATRRMRVPVRAVASVDEIMRPVRQEEVELGFGDDISSDEPPWLQFDRPDEWRDGLMILRVKPFEAVLESHRDLTVAVNIEVLRNGKVMFTSEAWWRWFRYTPDEEGFVSPLGPVILTPRCDLATMPVDGCWELQLTGDPIIALRNFDGTRYWAGQITMPIDLSVSSSE